MENRKNLEINTMPSRSANKSLLIFFAAIATAPSAHAGPPLNTPNHSCPGTVKNAMIEDYHYKPHPDYIMDDESAGVKTDPRDGVVYTLDYATNNKIDLTIHCFYKNRREIIFPLSNKYRRCTLKKGIFSCTP